MLGCDEVVWVAGAAPPPWLAASGLPSDATGFVRVGTTLQVDGHPDLFAVGDCAAFEPALAKAGVFAVRQGPVLARNLRAHLSGKHLRPYRPQRDFLALLNLGDGSALGTKWGLAAEGRSVFALKDRIDRRFVRRFQALGPGGVPGRGFAAMHEMAEVPCGGCAAKVGATPLARALARLGVPSDDAVVLGLGAGDDVAAVETRSGEVVVASLDSFRAFTNDPWLVGRIAAVHAASDLFAKGVAPRFALADVTVPDEHAEETLFQVLAGARAALDGGGVTLVGGHTTLGADLAVGFAVWGSTPDRDGLLRLGGLQAGDLLLLTKALGTGVLWRADMLGEARGAWMEAAANAMARSNAEAGRIAREVRASACTDVTGFGLAGHLAAMLRASKACARVELDSLPLLPGVRECLARGVRSTFHPENARLARALAVDRGAPLHPVLDALFDPQTSGGLLFGVAVDQADRAIARLREAGDTDAAVIGEVLPPRADGVLFEVVAHSRRAGARVQ
jgi:selenide,water dikinase